MDIKHMACAMQVKALSDDGVFSGYASVFGELDQHNEIVMAGAFKRSLDKWKAEGGMPAMLWMHDPTQPIGVWVSMEEDANGLLVKGRLALRTQKGAEAHELLRMKALTGLSIGYRVVSSRTDGKRKARLLTSLDLFEVSLVTFPANEAARVRDVKSPPTMADAGSAASQSIAGRDLSLAFRASANRLRLAARRLKERV